MFSLKKEIRSGSFSSLNAMPFSLPLAQVSLVWRSYEVMPLPNTLGTACLDRSWNPSSENPSL